MDGYRSQPDPHQSPYPSSYDQGYEPRTYHAPSYHQEPQNREPQSPKSRSSSIAPSDGLPQPSQQPLKNALNNAFDKSDSAAKVDPDIIAQITAEVKKSVLSEIKMNGMGVTGQPAPPHLYAPPVQSPITTTAIPSRNVYTPPSPKHADLSSHGSASPDPLARDPMFDGADDTPTPRTAPVDIPQEKSKPRPAPAPRMSTDGDLSPIEKMWKRLFDPHGQPTPRLGQFLRGLAVHLIDDYEPKHSLVITPAKMLRFYNDVRLNAEIYPWPTIFGKLPDLALSKLYREMRCQHHLVQENSTELPHIPALTPEGFQEWMTAMIQAYPDTEYERLSKAVLDMPISNADDCKERFPKELPRRLFPHQENLQAQQRCAAVLSAEGVGPLRRAPTFPPPPPMSQSASVPPSLERERTPYVSQQDPRVVESDDDEPISMPIERERKPYSAAPGGGKVFDDLSGSVSSDASLHEQRRRAQSTAASSQWAPPTNATQPQHHHRTASQVNGRRPRSPSFSAYGAHPDPTPQANGRRHRSPSFSNYGTQSDPSVRDIPGSYYTSNIHDSEEEKRRFAKEAEARRNEWAGRHASDASHHRRSTAGTDSSYESQPRSVYDDDYYRGRGATNGYDNRGYEPRRY